MNLRDLIAVLGHELRTPIAAILGYQELLADGIYGEIPEKQREPLERIQQSAHQLVYLLDGLQELAEAGARDVDELEATDTNSLAENIVKRLKPIADSRSVTLEFHKRAPTSLPLIPLQRFLRAAEIGMTAAVKKSHGRTLRLECGNHDGVHCELHGTALDAVADDPERFDLGGSGPTPSAALLRLAMAAASLRLAGGELRLLPHGDTVTLVLSLPVTK